MAKWREAFEDARSRKTRQRDVMAVSVGAWWQVGEKPSSEGSERRTEVREASTRRLWRRSGS
ncbi:hypothetical protein E4U55_005601 [Claviceps digitariae]|nr:hypothetical protein E4U55_005601 [Claviceps digitariae]